MSKTKSDEIPKTYQRFMENYPDVGKSYEKLGTAVHNAGPLDDKTRALLKLGISTGAWLEGAVHSHTRKALRVGAEPDEIRHTVILSLPTIGLPSMMAALTWVEDVLSKAQRS